MNKKKNRIRNPDLSPVILPFSFSTFHRFMTKDHHSFHTCPLRSSSLLCIINQTSRVIVAATDHVFDISGCSPADLIGKPIDDILQVLTTRHGPLQICVHQHDPLQKTTTGLLDYWLFQPQKKTGYHHQRGNTMATRTTGFAYHRAPLPLETETTVRLSPYGVVDSSNSTLKHIIGRPIMAFIHSDDVQTLCGQLKLTYEQLQCTFSVRWLIDNVESRYQRIIVTSRMKWTKKKKHIWLTMTPVCNPWSLETWMQRLKSYTAEYAKYLQKRGDHRMLCNEEDDECQVVAVRDGEHLTFISLSAAPATLPLADVPKLCHTWTQRILALLTSFISVIIQFLYTIYAF